MTQYVLLIDRTSAGFGFKMTATCAIVGEPSGHYGLCRTFDGEAALDLALNNARVADIEVGKAVQVVKSGFRSFAPITYDQAEALGLLANSTKS